MELRDYQQDCMNAIKNGVEHGVMRQLVVAPTGSGKTCMISNIAKTLGKNKKMLVLAHRDMLLQQNADKIKLWNPELNVEIEQAEKKVSMFADVVVASVPTIGRGGKRLEKFNPDDFDIIASDECVIGDTLIDTDVGIIPIKDAGKLGATKVLTAKCNKSDNVIYYSSIERFFSLGERETFTVTLGNGYNVTCTDNHKFYTKEGWKECKQLKLKDKIYVSADVDNTLNLTLMPINDIKKAKKENVYDIEVENTHCYFANGILVHNCHHSIANSYQNIYEYFGVDRKSLNPRIIHIGFTATPNRTDNVGLDAIYDEITYSIGINELIERGYLCHIVAYRVNTKTSLDGLKSYQGDFAQGELAKTVNNESRNQIILDSMNKYIPNKQTIVFCAGVEQAQALTDLLNKNNIKTAIVTGEVTGEDRTDILGKFKAKEIQVITNYAVLTEGFDEPSVEAIVQARPTKSQLVFQQAIGRGLRTHPDKEFVTILDVVDSTTKHSLVTTPSLFGLPCKFDAKGEDILKTAKTYNDKIQKAGINIPSTIESMGELNTYLEAVNILKRTQISDEIAGVTSFSWVKVREDTYMLNYDKGSHLSVQADALGYFEVKNHWLDNYMPQSENIFKEHSLDFAIRKADIWVKRTNPDAVRLVDTNMKWRKVPATNKQMDLIRKLRIQIPSNHEVTKGEAQILISQHFNR